MEGEARRTIIVQRVKILRNVLSNSLPFFVTEKAQNLEEDDQDSEEDSSSESNGESEELSEESSDECQDG